MRKLPKNLRIEELRQAIAYFLSIAWAPIGGREYTPPHVPIDEWANLRQALSHFENIRESKDAPLRYALRLGSRHYPYMKLVVEESRDADMLYLAVDTHDQVVFSPLAEGHTEWQALKDANLQMKQSIEEAWAKAGLPTLKAVARRQARSQRKSQVFLQSGAGDHRPLRVLIVDDEEDAAELLRLQLLTRNIEAVTCLWGEETASTLRDARKRNQPFDAVVMDYMMPGMSGREVCDAMRGQPDLKDLPVIIATYADLKNNPCVSATAVLTKPIDLDLLSKLLRQNTAP